jgi:hypothetical protein
MDIFPKVNILLISPNMIVFTNVVAQAGYILDFLYRFFSLGCFPITANEPTIGDSLSFLIIILIQQSI